MTYTSPKSPLLPFIVLLSFALIGCSQVSTGGSSDESNLNNPASSDQTVSDATYMYYAHGVGTADLMRKNMETGNSESIYHDSTGYISSLSRHIDLNTLFFIDGTQTKIMRKQGDSVVEAIVSGTDRILDVVLVGDMLYYLNVTTRQIIRCNLNGNDKTVMVQNSSLASTKALTINRLTGILYWVANFGGSDLYVYSIHSDGTHFQIHSIHSDMDLPMDIVADDVSDALLWVVGDGRIYRDNLDGQMPEIIIDDRTNIRVITTFEGMLYWAEYTTGDTIFKATLDGNSIQLLHSDTSGHTGLTM
ncbi:MAG: DUF5050 domain-containing protein [bacterium]|nr:DUF5050 domain-containing protein [bacterium]